MKNGVIVALMIVSVCVVLLFSACGQVVTSTEEISSSEKEAVTYAFAETEYGGLMGINDNGTYIFKGIQYGLADRFMPAAEPESWKGVKSALNYKETCSNTANTVSISSFIDNTSSDQVQNENCLYLNVWTQSLDSEANKPVVVFLHGGGYSSGSSNELSCYDGQNISEYGDIVFVNLNHRLNYLGFTDLSAYGDEYKDSGNLGIDDIVLALQWVQDNISNFGGDPSNVMIIGQSGGGGKVYTLMGIPKAQGLFNKAWICSGSSSGTDTETAKAAGTQLVENCKAGYGITDDAEALERIKTISYQELANLAADTVCGNGPVFGGDFYPELTYMDGKWVDMAKDIPLIISNTYAEFSGNDGALAVGFLIDMVGGAFDPENPDAFLASVYKPNMTEDDMYAEVKKVYGDATDEVLAAFIEAYPSRDTIDILSCNLRSNEPVIAKAEQGGEAVYQAVFSWEYPIMGGLQNYHTGGDLPFLFYNMDTREYMIQGDEDGAYKVGSEAATALINYARSGSPSSESLEWDAFTVEEGETMIFDEESQVIGYHDKELLQLVAEYRPASPF